MSDPLEINEQPRGLRLDQAVRDPVALVLGEMCSHTAQLNGLLADVACQWFELDQAVRDAAGRGADATANQWRGVEIVAGHLSELLASHQVMIEDATGHEWSDAMRADYELVGFSQRDDVETPHVAHVMSPLVRRFGKTIREGKVTVNAPASRSTTPPDGPHTCEASSKEGE